MGLNYFTTWIVDKLLPPIIVAFLTAFITIGINNQYRENKKREEIKIIIGELSNIKLKAAALDSLSRRQKNDIYSSANITKIVYKNSLSKAYASLGSVLNSDELKKVENAYADAEKLDYAMKIAIETTIFMQPNNNGAIKLHNDLLTLYWNIVRTGFNKEANDLEPIIEKLRNKVGW